MIQPLDTNLRITTETGAASYLFHRWLQLIQQALHGPFIGRMATGSKVIADGEYGLHAEEIILNGVEEIVIEGDGVLVIV
jgi:hypothetical protein